MTLYEKYAEESYNNSKDHGFHDEGDAQSKGEMVMLIISELGECQEADRRDFRSISKEGWNDQMGMLVNPRPNSWKVAFEKQVKNTVEDELADVAIRIMDYTMTWKIPITCTEFVKPSTDNFSHDLLRLAWYIQLAFEEKTELHPGKDWSYAFAAVEAFARDWGIDLDWHIKMKQVYNRTRPAKHGKAY